MTYWLGDFKHPACISRSWRPISRFWDAISLSWGHNIFKQYYMYKNQSLCKSHAKIFLPCWIESGTYNIKCSWIWNSTLYLKSCLTFHTRANEFMTFMVWHPLNAFSEQSDMGWYQILQRKFSVRHLWTFSFTFSKTVNKTARLSKRLKTCSLTQKRLC